MFIVLVSRHFDGDEFTTQFKHIINAKGRLDARRMTVMFFPQEYVPWWEWDKDHGRMVAHFTGEIYER